MTNRTTTGKTEPRPYTILYRDSDLFVCEKQPGLLSQPDRGGDPDLLTLLTRECGRRVYPVHRLDRGVGGLIAVAASERAASLLSAALSNPDGPFRKEYLAVVHGIPTEREGTLCDWLFHDERRRMTTVVAEGTPCAQAATLAYRTLESKEIEGKPFSLVAVRLETGRTHQIRAQFSHAGHPIAGDGRYGAHDRFPPLALHASYLSLTHPTTGEGLSFSSYPTALPFALFALPAPGKGGLFV